MCERSQVRLLGTMQSITTTSVAKTSQVPQLRIAPIVGHGWLRFDSWIRTSGIVITAAMITGHSNFAWIAS